MIGSLLSLLDMLPYGSVRDVARAVQGTDELPPTPLATVKGVNVEEGLRLQVYIRDGGRCLYCGVEVVPSALLWAAHAAWPTVVGYHRNAKTGTVAPAFDRRWFEADHLRPPGRIPPGAVNDARNIVTPCPRCNTRKGNRTPSECRVNLSSPAAPLDWVTLRLIYWRLRDGYDDTHDHRQGCCSGTPWHSYDFSTYGRLFQPTAAPAPVPNPLLPDGVLANGQPSSPVV
jgi:5-methylcytosine-specific restriction endonuclease McrA